MILQWNKREIATKRVAKIYTKIYNLLSYDSLTFFEI